MKNEVGTLFTISSHEYCSFIVISTKNKDTITFTHFYRTAVIEFEVFLSLKYLNVIVETVQLCSKSPTPVLRT